MGRRAPGRMPIWRVRCETVYAIPDDNILIPASSRAMPPLRASSVSVKPSATSRFFYTSCIFCAC